MFWGYNSISVVAKFHLGLGIVNRIARSLRIYCDNYVVGFFPKSDKYSKDAKLMKLKYLYVKEELHKQKCHLNKLEQV